MKTLGTFNFIIQDLDLTAGRAYRPTYK